MTNPNDQRIGRLAVPDEQSLPADIQALFAQMREAWLRAKRVPRLRPAPTAAARLHGAV